MGDEGKVVTRQEIYDAVCQHPVSKLAAMWNTKLAGVISACKKMKIPRPGSGHWALVKHGWQIERTPLPAERDTPIGASVPPPAKKREPKPEEPVKPRRKVDISRNFANEHRIVKHTKSADDGHLLAQRVRTLALHLLKPAHQGGPWV